MQENTPSTTTNVWRVPALPVVGVSNEPFATLYPIFRAAGYHPIPLKKGKKSPAITKYNQYADPDVDIGKGHEQAWLKQHAGGNVGIVCGRPVHETDDGRPLYLTAIDIDVNDERVWDAVTGSMPDWQKSLIKTSAFQGVIDGTSRGFTMIVLSTMLFGYGKKYKLDKLPPFEHISGKKKDASIDFISSGMQTVMPPSTHPDTGKPYVATHGLDLKAGWVRPVTELPIFDQAAFDRLAEALEFARTDPMFSPEHEQTALERASSATTAGAVERTGGGEHDDEQVQAFIEYMTYLGSEEYARKTDMPNWKRWFGIAKEFWRVCNEGELTEEDVIHYLSQIDAFKGKAATEDPKKLWREVSKARKEVAGECQSAAQIMAEKNARQTELRGWDERLIKDADVKAPTATELQEMTDKEVVEKALKNADEDGIEMPSELNFSDMLPLPQSLADEAPGLIGRIKDDILNMNRGASATFAVSTAISLVLQLGSRRVFGGQVGNTLPSRAYIMNLAGTTSGKNVFPQYARQFISALTERTQNDQEFAVFAYGDPVQRWDAKHSTKNTAGTLKPTQLEHVSVFENWEGSAGYTAPSAVWTDVWYSATPMIVIDEYGEVADGMSKTFAGGSAFTVLRTFYSDVRGEKMIGYAMNNENKPDALMTAMRRKPIFSPSPNIIAFSTAEQVFAGGGGDKSRVKDGTLNRFMYFYDEAKKRTLEETDDFLWNSKARTDIDRDLIEEFLSAYKSLHGRGEDPFSKKYFNTMDETSDVFSRTDERKVVSYDTPETRALMSQRYHAFYNRGLELAANKNPHDTGHAQLLGRVPENFFRLCLAAAIADPHPEKGMVYKKHHVEWAAGVAENFAHNIGSIYKTQMNSYRENKAMEDEMLVYDNMRKVFEAAKEDFYDGKKNGKNPIIVIDDRIYVKIVLARKKSGRKMATFDEGVQRLIRSRAADVIKIKMSDDGSPKVGAGPEYIAADEAF